MPTPIPPFTTLRAFETVARLGSFTAAAREMNLTQTAVSHQIRVLEETLNCKVLFRSNRSVTLTQTGEAYLETVRSSLTALQSATDSLRQPDNDNCLYLNVYPSFAARWLVPRLGRFKDQNPSINLRLDVSQDIVDLRTGAYDLAIRYGRGPWPETNAERLFCEDVFPVAAPKLLDQKPLDCVTDLSNHCVLHDVACDGSQDGWAHWLDEAGEPSLKFKGHITFSDSYLLLSAAVAGQGVALGRQMLIEDDIAKGRLKELFNIRLADEFAYWLVWSNDEPLSGHREAFFDWIKSETLKIERA